MRKEKLSLGIMLVVVTKRLILLDRWIILFFALGVLWNWKLNKKTGIIEVKTMFELQLKVNLVSENEDLCVKELHAVANTISEKVAGRSQLSWYDKKGQLQGPGHFWQNH